MWWNRYQWDPLWENFDAFILDKNHRQGDDRLYADILNRLRFGNHTEDDVAQIKSRIVPDFPNHIPSNAMLLYGKKAEVKEYNTKKLNQLEGELFTIPAKHIHPTIKNFKPSISKEGGVSDHT